jgi:hypothetical protein
MSEIKQRRLTELNVDCHAGTKVGEYVPFYFCPRSVMLFILYKRNHPSLTYRGGQAPIVHLQADLDAVITWAEREGARWAFSDRNAGGHYASFFCQRGDFGNVSWAAVDAVDFRDANVKDGKQAEFLVHGSFPFQLVNHIGVQNAEVERQVAEAIAASRHRPAVSVTPEWYY